MARALLVNALVVATTAAIGLSSLNLAQAAYPEKTVRFISQSKPGSGFDTITRAVANTLATEKLIEVPMPVTNMPSSTVGLAQIVQRHKNDPYMISFQSIAGHMGYGSGNSEYSFRDVTPIARIASDFYGIFVRADSPMQTLDDFLDPLKQDPKAFPITGGRSDDRVFYGLLFEQAGIDPVAINYIAYAGGGEATAALLEGSTKAMITTIGEVVGALNAGQIRMLAFSGPERLRGELAAVPTLKESGTDLEWANFRYAMGGPDMPADAVAFWQDTFARMVKTPTWQEVLTRYNWADHYLADGLDGYLTQTQDDITAALKRLGMVKQ